MEAVSIYQIELYKTRSGDCPVKIYLKDLIENGRKKDASKIIGYIAYLEQFGYKLPSVNSKIACRLSEDICELRPLPHRVLYYYCAINGKYVLLHAFEKKTNETPPKEKEKAKSEAIDYERRIINEENKGYYS